MNAPRTRQEVLDISIDRLDRFRHGERREYLPITGRALERIKAAGIKTVRDLAKSTKGSLLKLPGFAKKSLESVEATLYLFDLPLGATDEFLAEWVKNPVSSWTPKA